MKNNQLIFDLFSILKTTDYPELSGGAASLNCKIFTECIWGGIQNPMRTEGKGTRWFYIMILVGYKKWMNATPILDAMQSPEI